MEKGKYNSFYSLKDRTENLITIDRHEETRKQVRDLQQSLDKITSAFATIGNNFLNISKNLKF